MASSSLVSLAQMMALDPADAIALPCVLDVAAQKVGMTRDQMVEECRVNAALRDYLAGACRTAIADVIA